MVALQARAEPNDAAPSTVPNATPIAPASGIEIHWEAPPECPAEDEVKLYTERLLGQPLQTPRASLVVARGKVRRAESGNWELLLKLTSGDRTSEETLVAARCRSLADVTSLKVALAMDPVAVADTIIVAAEPPPETRAPAPLVAPPPTPPKADFALRAQGGAEAATFRTAAAGVAAFISFERSNWRAELGGAALWGSRAQYSDLPTIGARLQLYTGTLRACVLPRVGSITFPLCGGVEAGAMRAEGYGVAETFTATSPWVALELAPAVRFNLDRRLSFWVEGDGLVPVVRSSFTVRNLENLYTAPPGGLRAWIGMELRLFP
jgi:hypothetical protein